MPVAYLFNSFAVEDVCVHEHEASYYPNSMSTMEQKVREDDAPMERFNFVKTSPMLVNFMGEAIFHANQKSEKDSNDATAFFLRVVEDNSMRDPAKNSKGLVTNGD